jgi:hypothetical protein
MIRQTIYFRNGESEVTMVSAHVMNQLLSMAKYMNVYCQENEDNAIIEWNGAHGMSMQKFQW